MTAVSELLPLDAHGRHRLKVAFVGTHGVGKTTLCFDLAAQLKRLDLGVDIVKEVARRCPLPINEDTTLEAQRWILHTQIAEEIEAAAAYVLGAPAFDGKRAVSVGFQQEIDGIIDDLIADFAVPVFRLDPAAREGWTLDAVVQLGLPAQPPQIDLFAAERQTL
ncbi:hypothetical protein [Gemmatimonas sp.]|uniref:hypothetical protein n=1 Tax=Gemmatimonas sp. TaxID=1962908 RepID=UPI00286AFB77|nr:hypothetical protein [Gemmatimonas sp.]